MRLGQRYRIEKNLTHYRLLLREWGFWFLLKDSEGNPLRFSSYAEVTDYIEEATHILKRKKLQSTPFFKVKEGTLK